MGIKNIKIENFTVFKKTEINFGSSINVFIGENGTGKTHLLKLMNSLLRSSDSRIDDLNKYFRTKKKDSFINDKTAALDIKMEISHSGVDNTIEINYQNGILKDNSKDISFSYTQNEKAHNLKMVDSKYSRKDDEVMLSCEIETFESMIDDFINDRTKEKETLGFIEPDFVFVFLPSYNKVKSEECSYVTSGHETSAAIMEWKVNLWSGGLTCNYFSTTFDKDEMRIMRDYLRLVIGKTNVDSDDIKEHIESGVIAGHLQSYS